MLEKAKTVYSKAEKIKHLKLAEDFYSEVNIYVNISKWFNYFENSLNEFSKDELTKNDVDKYIKIVKNVIDITLIDDEVETGNLNENECESCGFVVCENPKNAPLFDIYGTIVCEKCGYQKINISRSSTYKDNSRIDTGSKNTYEDLANFMKRMDAFEGKQKTYPPTNLIKTLESYINDNKKLGNDVTLDDVKNLPTDKYGKKKGTSLEIIEQALYQTSNSGFYRDLDYLGHCLFGWELAKITESGLRKILISDYISTQKIYEEYKERESSLNVNLRLYYHLRAREYHCRITDFKIVSSRESLEYHQRMFNIMSKKSGLPLVTIDY